LQKNQPTGQFSTSLSLFLAPKAESTRRADQARKQTDFGIVGLAARHWLFSFGHTSGQQAVHAASITGYSCGEGCA
jgi:hypothetical protein